MSTAYEEGAKAFANDKPCPYPYDDPNYEQWWRGWEDAAGQYLDAALGAAWSFDDDQTHN